MTTAVYYTEEKHSLPSLSSIMSTQSDELFSNPSQPSTANTTPASSFSGKSGVPDGLSSNTMGHQPMANKCTCKSNANRIPRPRNAFILFRQKYHQSVLEEGTVIRTNPEVSRELGRRWRALSNEDREHWNQLAEEEKTNHAKKYPGYRYTPRRNGKNKNCEYCKQKNLRQQQIQLHNQQLLSLQDQYYMQQQQGQGQPPMGQQQHPPPMGQQYPQQYNQQLGQMNQMPQQLSGSQSLNGTQTPNQMNNMMYNYPSFNQQLPMNNMQFFIPSNLNPIQTNFVYNNDDKLSPLSQPFDQHYQQGQGVQPPQQQQSQQPQPQQPQQQQQPQPQSAQLSASSQPTSANGVAGIPGTNQLPGSIPPVGGFNPQFAVGYERFNLPNPYGFENNYSN